MIITSTFTNRSKKYDHNRNYKFTSVINKQTAAAIRKASYTLDCILKLARSK